eukprot:CAMPEP_0184403988 /NCGR_PEP_ID=MMETSP0007-20130409/85701_1 /TAXON_ID=97485 /ORGANISM="Prymnesium parvum, Strain Texoma1" /LENGTH=118 /DNA_ID=CAMNT_0026760121 /DNA_START=400 /DNA_END=756 /DNA_ORIENTATION=+
MRTRKPACTSAVFPFPDTIVFEYSVFRCTASSGERSATTLRASTGSAPHGTSPRKSLFDVPSTSITSPPEGSSSVGSSARESMSSQATSGLLRCCAMHSAAAEKEPEKAPSTPSGVMK